MEAEETLNEVILPHTRASKSDWTIEEVEYKLLYIARECVTNGLVSLAQSKFKRCQLLSMMLFKLNNSFYLCTMKYRFCSTNEPDKRLMF